MLLGQTLVRNCRPVPPMVFLVICQDQYQKDGILTHIHLALSREQKVGLPKSWNIACKKWGYISLDIQNSPNIWWGSVCGTLGGSNPYSPGIWMSRGILDLLYSTRIYCIWENLKDALWPAAVNAVGPFLHQMFFHPCCFYWNFGVQIAMNVVKLLELDVDKRNDPQHPCMVYLHLPYFTIENH